MALLTPRAGAIIFCNNSDQIHVCVIHYADRDIWDFPRGHIKENEEPKHTAIRELYEETGIKSNLPYRAGTIQQVGKSKSVLLHYEITFYSDVIGCKKPNPIDTKEIKDSKWISIQDAIRLFKDRPNIIGLMIKSLIYFMKSNKL